MSTTYTFSIPDIMCPSCVNTVNNHLNPPAPIAPRNHLLQLFRRIKAYFIIDEDIITILDASTNLLTHQLTVTVEEDGLPHAVVMNALNAKLAPIGFRCTEITSQLPPSKVRIRMFQGLVGIATGVSLLILPFVMPVLPMLAMVLIGASSVVLTLTLGAASYKKAASIFFLDGGLHMDTLFTVSTLAAIGVSIAAFWVPGLPMMFEVGLLIFGFRHIGEGIRESLELKMGFKTRFQDKAPKTVKKVIDDNLVEVMSKELVVGDLIVVEAGMVLSVDGVYVDGVGRISTVADDGLKRLRSVSINDALYAGMQLADGAIRMRVMAPVHQSLLARKDACIAASINEKEKASWETQADKYLRYFIPGVFLLAITSGVIVGCFFSPALAIQCAVAVLVSACPCTLGLVTSMAVQVGMKKALNEGILFKSTRKLERVFQVEHVVFDLNGTLTTITPYVDSFEIINCTEKEFFGYYLALEAHARKSIAKAIREYAQKKGAIPAAILEKDQIDSTNHSGVTAMIEGMTYHIGDWQMMKDKGICIDEPQMLSDQTAIYLARGTTVLGHIILRRPLRPEAVSVIAALKKMKKKIHLFSGSNEKTVKRYAQTLGIPVENLQWECTSSSKPKVDFIRELKKDGRVAMIGDEENDAEAIAESDFGVAMPVDGESNISQQEAEAVFKNDSLKPIVAAFEISYQTAANINQNLLFSLTYNIAAVLLAGGLLLTVGVVLNPSIGVALMILQTSLILLNTYRFKQQKLVSLNEDNHPVLGKESSYTGMMSLISPQPNLLSQEEGRLPCQSQNQLTSSSDGYANSSRILHGMRLTNTDRQLSDEEQIFDSLSNALGNRLD